GQACTSDCQLGFAPGAPATLHATVAGPGSLFGGWGGACSGSADCALTLGADATVEATFNASAATVTVNVAITGPGTVTLDPPGSSCGPGCSQYNNGTPVVLTPVPSAGLSFIAWSGGPCDSATAACTLTLVDNASVVATFCQFNHVTSPTGDDG